MRWNKKGLIYCANSATGWARSHAALPTPYLLNPDVIRIYCAFRADQNISRIGYVDVRAENPKEVIAVSPTPVLDIGEPGMFDDNGVVPHSLWQNGKELYLYYAGFQLGTRIPYTMLSGLAISTDGGHSFTRHQRTPITDRHDREPFFRTAAHVLREGDTWHMWYVAGGSWHPGPGKQLPNYSMKYLTSADGLNWPGAGAPCFEPEGDEFGFGRPYVIREDGIYKMYYSIRTHSKKYRLGYAESPDGKSWQRKDAVMQLQPSPSGPDSDMMCYSAVFTAQGKTYLFYNGNDHGGTGILYAESA